MTHSVLGAYGPWAASLIGNEPGTFSLRSGRFRDLAAWRRKARARVWERFAPISIPRVPKPRVEARGEYDGLRWERLSWQLSYGPRTEAVALKPAGAAPRARLPAVLALHDHGGLKFFGWPKIARIGDDQHPLMRDHQRDYYGGVAWANEIAKRGHVVLVADAFAFGSRRVRIADVPEGIRAPTPYPRGVDPSGAGSPDDIAAYNSWARWHETPLAKSLGCAGTTWPGVFVPEDQAALSVLCARPDVDSRRVACAGLSGGGLRSAYLAGLDDRIACAVVTGFMTTWRDFLLNKSWTCTGMAFVPHLPRELDFPEILALRAPKPALVQNCWDDGLYTVAGMKRAAAIMRDVYRRAGAPQAGKTSFHPGVHVFDLPMQAEAFAWIERWLGAPARSARVG